MRKYYATAKYKAWQNAYRRKKYAENKDFREYQIKKVQKWYKKNKAKKQRKK